MTKAKVGHGLAVRASIMEDGNFVLPEEKQKSLYLFIKVKISLRC